MDLINSPAERLLSYHMIRETMGAQYTVLFALLMHICTLLGMACSVIKFIVLKNLSGQHYFVY